MHLLASVLAGLALQVAQDTSTTPVQSPADAYLDAGAEEMVRRARARTESENRLIDAYRVTARRQESVHWTAFGRERLAARTETVAKIEWEKTGPARVEILGVRDEAPLFKRGALPPDDPGLAHAARELVIEPSREWGLGAPGLSLEKESGGLIAPLEAGSEASYRFRSGDPITIRLPDGRTIRLLELQVIPRRTGHRLVSGSLWLDAESFAPVRGAFRFSVPVAVGAYSERGSWGVPGEFSLLFVEYGLWGGRWWLPRRIALEGVASVASMSARYRMERVYEDYEVLAAGDPPLAAAAAAWASPDGATVYESRTDTTSRCAPANKLPDGACRTFSIWTPRDRSALLSSEHLAVAPDAADGDLLSADERREALDLLYGSGVLSALLPRPRFDWRWIDPALFHFNRVEGATLGTTASAELANLRLAASAWAGTADRSVGIQTSLTRSFYSGRQRLAAYRRLDAFSPGDRPFELGNTLSALALGHDQGDYFRATGVELLWSPSAAVGPGVEWRLYAERQRAVEANTDFSFRRALGGEGVRPNPAADEANQVGASGTLHLARGLDPLGWRAGLDLSAAAETGTRSFLQPSARASLGIPLPGALAGALELAGGGSLGDPPVQRLWRLGGPSTVRGIGTDGRLYGEAFWRARAELGLGLPIARLAAFGDAGWAGRRAELSLDPPLLSVGVGGSFLDGLLRVDLARPLRGDSGWRLEVYLGGAL